MNERVRTSLSDGVLGALRQRLQHVHPASEADQFAVELRMTLLDYSMGEEERLTRRYLRHVKEYAPDDPSLGPRAVDGETHAMLARNGERWQKRYASRHQFVERIAAIMVEFG